MSEVKLRHYPEAACAALLVGLFRLLPLDWASALGGAIAGFIGPLLPLSRKAERRAADILGIPAAEARTVIRAMWRHLGRCAGEFPHVPEMRPGGRHADRLEVTGREHGRALFSGDKGGFLMTGHIGNWEVQPAACLHLGQPALVVYRAANNPLVDAMIDRFRQQTAAGTAPKGAQGAKDIVRAVRKGGFIGMLVDQKMNDGLPVPFFGRPAMSPAAIAQMALRYDVPIVPIRCERLDGARFRVSFHPPVEIAPSGEREADVLTLMARVNDVLEGWIRERPEQWLWLHKRWPE